MKRPRVCIVDYGMGNLFSLQSALAYIGADPLISDDPKSLENVDRLILPGVGAFGRGMKELEQRGFSEAIKKFSQKNRPLMGICLGMQLFMSKSYEFGAFRGLDIIQGSVVPFTFPQRSQPSFKVPHMGWTPIEQVGDVDPILKGIQLPSDFYFVHSYFAVPEKKENVFAISHYGEDQFCAMIRHQQIVGVQFHPEKSGPVGLRLLKNFFELR